jgi:hypothetical protein
VDVYSRDDDDYYDDNDNDDHKDISFVVDDDYASIDTDDADGDS